MATIEIEGVRYGMLGWTFSPLSPLLEPSDDVAFVGSVFKSIDEKR